MAGYLIPFLLLLSGLSAFSLGRDSTYTIINGEKVYKRVQFKPEFPGGTDSLLAFIDKHLIPPKGSNGATVTAVFIIDAGGKIVNVRIDNSSNPEYSKEAERVIWLMPLWKPAVHLGKKVPCFFTMPITFEHKTPK